MNELKVHIDFKEAVPFWVETTEHRTGYWHPGFGMTTISSLTIVVPTDHDVNKDEAINQAIDCVIKLLSEYKQPRAQTQGPT